MSARAKQTEAGAVSVLLPGYTCTCARCGRQWLSVCTICLPMLNAAEAQQNMSAHSSICAPPVRCPGCKSVGWERPAAWTPGEGTSRESVRRRSVAARSARAKRKTKHKTR